MLCSPKVFYDAVLPHPVQHGLLPGFDQKDEATDPDTFPVPSTATHVAVSAHPNRLTPDSLKKTCSAATRLQPLVVDTVDSKISLIFDDPVLLAMSIRTEVVCSGGGTTATDTRVSLMVSSLEIVVPWRPFKDTNNSCTVHVQAMARQFTSSHMLSYSAAMTNTIATIKQPLQFTVGQPGTFPVYLPSSFNMQQPASCSGDSTASAVCRTHGLDAPTHLLTSSPTHLLTSSPHLLACARRRRPRVIIDSSNDLCPGVCLRLLPLPQPHRAPLFSTLATARSMQRGFKRTYEVRHIVAQNGLT